MWSWILRLGSPEGSIANLPTAGPLLLVCAGAMVRAISTSSCGLPTSALARTPARPIELRQPRHSSQSRTSAREATRAVLRNARPTLYCVRCPVNARGRVLPSIARSAARASWTILFSPLITSPSRPPRTPVAWLASAAAVVSHICIASTFDGRDLSYMVTILIAAET
jgi:hypothetical protein